MPCSLVGECRHIIIPFCSIDALGAYKVGIGALPSPRNCCTMEIDEQMMLCGTLKKFYHVSYIEIVVTGKEINFHTLDTDFLTPCELFLSVVGIIESEFRTRCPVYPADRGIIPDDWLDARFDTFLDCIFYRLTLIGCNLWHFIPFCINQNVRQLHLYSQIDVFPYYIYVIGTMIIRPINPRSNAWLDP